MTPIGHSAGRHARISCTSACSSGSPPRRSRRRLASAWVATFQAYQQLHQRGCAAQDGDLVLAQRPQGGADPAAHDIDDERTCAKQQVGGLRTCTRDIGRRAERENAVSRAVMRSVAHQPDPVKDVRSGSGPPPRRSRAARRVENKCRYIGVERSGRLVRCIARDEPDLDAEVSGGRDDRESGRALHRPGRRWPQRGRRV